MAWHVFRAMNRCEDLAITWFHGRMQNIICYVPYALRLVKPRGRKSEHPQAIQIPALDGYFFMQVQADFRWDKVQYNPHCIGYLRDRNGPLDCHPDYILEVMRKEARGDFNKITCATTVKHQIDKGQFLYVNGGTYHGLEGEVDEVTPDKIVLRVRMLGTDTYVDFPVSNVNEIFNNYGISS